MLNALISSPTYFLKHRLTWRRITSSLTAMVIDVLAPCAGIGPHVLTIWGQALQTQSSMQGHPIWPAVLPTGPEIWPRGSSN